MHWGGLAHINICIGLPHPHPPAAMFGRIVSHRNAVCPLQNYTITHFSTAPPDTASSATAVGAANPGNSSIDIPLPCVLQS